MPFLIFGNLRFDNVCLFLICYSHWILEQRFLLKPTVFCFMKLCIMETPPSTQVDKHELVSQINSIHVGFKLLIWKPTGYTTAGRVFFHQSQTRAGPIHPINCIEVLTHFLEPWSPSLLVKWLHCPYCNPWSRLTEWSSTYDVLMLILREALL